MSEDDLTRKYETPARVDVERAMKTEMKLLRLQKEIARLEAEAHSAPIDRTAALLDLRDRAIERDLAEKATSDGERR